MTIAFGGSLIGDPSQSNYSNFFSSIIVLGITSIFVLDIPSKTNYCSFPIEELNSERGLLFIASSPKLFYIFLL